jgi:hypothetical protein
MERMTVKVLAPSAEASKSARRIGGNDSNTSPKRWPSRSNVPPRKALAIAHSAPSVVPSNTDVTATNRDHFVPWMIRLSTSRPMKSVPSQCFPLGSWALASGFGLNGSSGATAGANTPMSVMTTATIPQTAGTGERRANRLRWWRTPLRGPFTTLFSRPACTADGSPVSRSPVLTDSAIGSGRGFRGARPRPRAGSSGSHAGP